MQQSWHSGRMGAQRQLRHRLRQLCIEEAAAIPAQFGFGKVTRLGQVDFRIESGSQVKEVKQRTSGKTIIADVLCQQIDEVVEIISKWVAQPHLVDDMPRTRQLALPFAA